MTAARRSALAVADQAVSSASNFALTVLVAHSVSRVSFGAFSVMLATYILIIGVMRGVTSEPFVVAFSAAPVENWRAAGREAYGATLTISIALGGMSALSGLLVGGEVGRLFIALAVLLPGILLQDNWRYLALAKGQPGAALANDMVLAAVQLPVSVWLVATHHASAVSLTCVWGAAAYMGTLMSFFVHHLLPAPARTIHWLRTQWHLASRYALDDFMGIGAFQAASFAVAAAAGLAAAGGLRAGQTLFGPLLVVNSGVTAASTPELVRLRSATFHRVDHVVRNISIGLAFVATAWGAVALLLPSTAGTSLFGPTWPAAKELLPFLVAAQIAYGVRVGPTAGLRALGAANRSVAARFWGTLVGLLLPVAGAIAGGSRGAVIALAISAPVQAAIYWYQYRVAHRLDGTKHPESTSAVSPEIEAGMRNGTEK